MMLEIYAKQNRVTNSSGILMHEMFVYDGLLIDITVSANVDITNRLAKLNFS